MYDTKTFNALQVFQREKPTKTMKNAQNKTFQKLKLAADSIFLFRYIDKGDDLIEELSVNEPGGSPSVSRIDVYIPPRYNNQSFSQDKLHLQAGR